jgi:hypothetical protein
LSLQRLLLALNLAFDNFEFAAGLGPITLSR